ncbi:MAG: response regulator [Erysipelotrichaceae bacterium]|nr:response regulator [Erysipelotrichaceae bacterium]
MDEEFLKHIFEPFSRENNTTDAKVEGTGLGMPIVKRLVEIENGTIDIKSKKNEGTTITVTAYHRIASANEVKGDVAKDVNPEIFKDKRILLVEDNELNAEIAMEILKDAGFIIEHASDGLIALNILKEKEIGYYDLVLMDIQMPNMNGYETTVAIRSLNDERANIPIIAMTANAFEEDKREALRVGMNGHIAKPINVKGVLEQLAKIIRQSTK